MRIQFLRNGWMVLKGTQPHRGWGPMEWPNTVSHFVEFARDEILWQRKVRDGRQQQ